MKDFFRRDCSEILVRNLGQEHSLPYNPKMSKNKLFLVTSCTASKSFEKDLLKVVFLC